jgi:hypothetical protein
LRGRTIHMTELRELWITLTTADAFPPLAGTDADMFLEFGLTGRSFKLPDQSGNDLEQPGIIASNATTYIFHVDRLSTVDFVPGTVTLRNGNQNPLIPGPLGQLLQGWRCHAVLILGLGEDGKFYPLVAMRDVDRWLAADEPEGLVLRLDVLKPSEVGILEGVRLVMGGD